MKLLLILLVLSIFVNTLCAPVDEAVEPGENNVNLGKEAKEQTNEGQPEQSKLKDKKDEGETKRVESSENNVEENSEGNMAASENNDSENQGEHIEENEGETNKASEENKSGSENIEGEDNKDGADTKGAEKTSEGNSKIYKTSNDEVDTKKGDEGAESEETSKDGNENATEDTPEEFIVYNILESPDYDVFSVEERDRQ